MITCRAKLAEIGIPGVKIVAGEFTFDGARLSLLYSTESEGKVDLRKLNNTMQRLYPRSRVEMRQVGPRMWLNRWAGWALAVWITAAVRCS